MNGDIGIALRLPEHSTEEAGRQVLASRNDGRGGVSSCCQAGSTMLKTVLRDDRTPIRGFKDCHPHHPLHDPASS
ncbi:hypothetical protein ACVBEG_27115 [Pseudomonas sp. GG8]